MGQKLAGIAITAGLGVVMTMGLDGSARAATGVVQVPCSTKALRSALASASNGETMSLARGCGYTLTASLPVISQDLTIVGHGATLTRSYVPGTPAFTILKLVSGDVTVNAVNFRNGDNAIRVTGLGMLTVNGGTFTGNRGEQGGAIFFDNDGFSQQVTGATFTGNTAASDGGAISDHSPAIGVSVDHCRFIGNKAGRDGGGFFEYGFGDGGVTDSAFRGNSARRGGAIWISENFTEGLSGDVVRDNRATGDGGGIYVEATGGAGADINAQVYRNHAGGRGGGIAIVGEVETSSVDGYIHGNSASDGGGIANDGGTLLVGGTISGNRASADGGGLYNQGQSAGLSISGGTVSVNHAGAHGGGIDNQGEMDATGTRILRNTAASGGGGIYDDGPYVSVALTIPAVLRNRPDNCEPLGSITGCG